MTLWDIHDESLYDTEHLVVKHLFESPHVSVVWFGFHAGQTLKDHETTSEAIIQVLYGHVTLTTATSQELSTGQTVILPPNLQHALTASEDSLVQLIIVPHPKYHSLQKELQL
jgi:quercetin dioxygenase-like cupin family protein